MPRTNTTVDRPGRRRLDAEAVLQAAEALVDGAGYDALTMTALAEQLQTRVSTLYNHVESLQELRATVQVRAMRLLAERLRSAAMGYAGAGGVVQMGQALRRFAAAYPHRYAAITRAPIDRERFFDAAQGATEALWAMVRSCGVPEDRVLATSLAIFSAMHGFVALEVAGYFGAVEDLDAVFDQVAHGAVVAAGMQADGGAA